MSTSEHRISLFNRFVEVTVRLSQIALTSIANLRKVRQSRSLTAQLLTRDDRLLHDMGVTRGDIEQALAVDWDQDPAAALAEIRRRRLQADRQGLMADRVR